MTFGDFKSIVGKQRALWVLGADNKIVSGMQQRDVELVLIESGTATLDPGGGFTGDSVHRAKVRIPIFDVPPGAEVVRAVASANVGSFFLPDDVDGTWAVDAVHTDVELNSRTFVILADIAAQGAGCRFLRVGYHVTAFLSGTDVAKQPDTLANLSEG